MDRYATLFQRLEQQNQGAFVPFVTLGDPTPELSFELIKTLVDSGADALELGIPFSDPLADGPTIQNANLRALAAKTTPERCFELVAQIRQHYPQLPIGLLMYANLVYARGIEHFYARCQQAGVDSVLIADVPTNESAPFRAAAQQYGIKPIFIAPPTASEATLQAVAQLGEGYTYLLSRSGVTGTESKAQMPQLTQLDILKKYQAPPALLGFGISTPEQVKQAIAAGAAGAISGSAIVKIIEQYHHNPTEMLEKLANFTQQMKAATKI